MKTRHCETPSRGERHARLLPWRGACDRPPIDSGHDPYVAASAPGSRDAACAALAILAGIAGAGAGEAPIRIAADLRAGFSYPKSVLSGDWLYVSYATNREDAELTRVPVAALGAALQE